MTDELAAIVARWRAGACSPEIALMELLLARPSVAAIEAEVRGAPELATLLRANEVGCERLCAMVQGGVDDCGADATVEKGVHYARRLFDWSVQAHEELSVALYSLGNPAILDRATDEVVRLLEGWGVLTPGTRALEIGCGIGRLLRPIAARVGQVIGIDLSDRMVEVARRRCAGDARIEVRGCTGLDLAGHAGGAFDLVYAVDSWPYVVEAGEALAASLVVEVARVLAPGGRFALLGHSYGGDDGADRAQVAAHAAAAGLEVQVAGERPFTLWNGLAFLLVRPRVGIDDTSDPP